MSDESSHSAPPALAHLRRLHLLMEAARTAAAEANNATTTTRPPDEEAEEEAMTTPAVVDLTTESSRESSPPLQPLQPPPNPLSALMASAEQQRLPLSELPLPASHLPLPPPLTLAVPVARRNPAPTPSASTRSPSSVAPGQVPPALTGKCDVCNDNAPQAHLNYGANSCLSCRAFFRRVTQRDCGPRLVCRAGGNCVLAPDARRCQACRYKGCVRAGMRAECVLTKSEVMNRFGRRAAKLKEMEQHSNAQGSSSELLKEESHNTTDEQQQQESQAPNPQQLMKEAVASLFLQRMSMIIAAGSAAAAANAAANAGQEEDERRSSEEVQEATAVASDDERDEEEVDVGDEVSRTTEDVIKDISHDERDDN